MKRILVTGGAGFIGSNLVLELQNRYPDAQITVIDDFRSANFKNLETFRGNIVAQNLATLDWKTQFEKPRWDAIFHLASITDTREENQYLMIHDNVESFDRLLKFAYPERIPIIYATSAATYGKCSGANKESDPVKPANVYAFSKVMLENLAKKYAAENPDWKIVGLKYFNVYGPREAHKGVPASMIYHLAQQMSAGKKPRLFKHGEQVRDFVYVKDIVNFTIGALGAKKSMIFNAGTGKPRPFNDIIQILNKLFKTNLETEYFDNPYINFYQSHTEADMTKMKTELGLEAQFSLEDGVADYYNSGLLLNP
jgi:ADP-L-glycero-D-manno-heptose 6-epimerase